MSLLQLLSYSFRQGHWSIADAILKEDMSGSKQIDSSGRTALMISSLEGHLGKY